MTNLTKLVSIALAGVVIATSAASAMILPPTHNTKPHQQNVGIECRVHDADFWVINWGNVVLDSGRQIEWSSPTTKDSGVFLLPKMLAPGEEVKLADLLSVTTYTGAPCNAAIV